MRGRKLTIVQLPSTRGSLFGFNASGNCLVRVRTLHSLRFRLAYNHYAMVHAYNAGKPHAQGSDQARWSHRRQSEYTSNLLLALLWWIKHIGEIHDSYHNFHKCTLRTLYACCSQSGCRILKVWESSTHALFLYNCTPNTLLACERSMGFIHIPWISLLKKV